MILVPLKKYKEDRYSKSLLASPNQKKKIVIETQIQSRMNH